MALNVNLSTKLANSSTKEYVAGFQQRKSVNLVMRENQLPRLLQKRWFQHTIFWLVVLCYFIMGYTRNGNYKIEALRSIAFLPNHMFIAYSFLYFLLPRFLYTKRFLLFFIGAIVVYTLSMLFSGFINFYILCVHKTSWSLGASLLGQSTVLGIAISVKLIKTWYQQRQQILEMQHQKITAELELLKSQLHPHFLFNTLNNLYSHTLNASTQAPEIVLKLSHLLRFMIYESNVPLIPLKKEVGLLQQYIELEQLRYGERLDVSIAVRGEMEGKQIAPLLLLPLVENAFKHGTSTQLDQCWISFDLEVGKNRMILKLINSKDADPGEKHEVGGIGLQNVRRRLDYLYQDRHQLTIKEEEEVFVVMLELELDEMVQNTITIQTGKSNKTNGVEMLISR